MNSIKSWNLKKFITLVSWLQFSQTEHHFLQNHEMNSMKLWNLKKFYSFGVRGIEKFNDLGVWGLETKFGSIGANLTCSFKPFNFSKNEGSDSISFCVFFLFYQLPTSQFLFYKNKAFYLETHFWQYIFLQPCCFFPKVF